MTDMETQPERNEMKNYKLNGVISSDGRTTITIMDSELNCTTVTEEHPNFLRIIEAHQKGEDVFEWLDARHGLLLTKLSDRVSVDDEGVIYFDGDPVYNGLATTIQRYRREGRDPQNLIRFMERLSANPSFRSREQLFTWTQAKELVIDHDGYIIAYKGVTEYMLSIHSGSADVDGVTVTGRIPNEVGTVISMPREKVQDDPNHGCSHGLHVGNWGYASGFGRVVLEVRIDPADVVSVPADCSYQKLRCCRYEVVDVHENDYDDLDDYEPESVWDEDEAMDGFSTWMESAPPTFTQRIIDRLRGVRR